MKFLMHRLLFVILFFSFGFGLAQNNQEIEQVKKNLIRYNPMGTLVWKSIPLYYERKMNKVVAFSMGAGYIIPHQIQTSVLSFESDNLNGKFNDGRTTGYYFTPEFKFYLKGKAPKGFYISRYVRYMKYNVGFNGSFYDETGNSAFVNITVSLKEYGTGRQYGYQWLIGEKWSLDFFFAGPRISTYTIGFKANAKIKSEEWEQLQKEVEEEYDQFVNKIGLKFLEGKLPFNINNQNIKLSYPFSAGNFRHGIAIGFRF